MRIAMLAPPWIPVPAPAYGGVEEVVRLLCDGLAARGHDVTLFAPPGSESRAAVVPVLEEPHPEAIENAQFEADHVARAFAEIDAAAGRGEPYDVIHDHVGYTARHGRTGFVVGDEREMACAVARLGEIDPEACRGACERRFGVPAAVGRYEQVYSAAAAHGVPAREVLASAGSG